MFNYSNVEGNNMKKSYKIDVDCANCANKMEVAANNTEGVKSAVVNFMMLKMNVEFEDGIQMYLKVGLNLKSDSQNILQPFVRHF